MHYLLKLWPGSYFNSFFLVKTFSNLINAYFIKNIVAMWMGHECLKKCQHADMNKNLKYQFCDELLISHVMRWLTTESQTESWGCCQTSFLYGLETEKKILQVMHFLKCLFKPFTHTSYSCTGDMCSTCFT